VAALQGSFGTIARADIILYDHLAPASTHSDSVAQFSPLADSFSTGSTAVLLTDVKVILDGAPGPPGSTIVQLLGDASTHPGAVLANIATLNNSSLSFAPTTFDFPLATPYPLNPNTRYWVGLSSVGGSTADWHYGGPAVPGEFFSGHGSVFPATSPYQMQVRGTADPVPEPGSLALLTLGGLGLAGWRWRRSKTA
jgi:hypothetical protein